MKKPILSLLRDKKTTTEDFRKAADNMGAMLSFEVLGALDKVEYPLETPLMATKGEQIKKKVVLIPILRAGIALLAPFLKLFPESRVGFVGIRRDENTALPSLYYKNIPEITEEDVVIILDPMIATGGSGHLLIELLKSLGVKEEQLLYASVIAAPEGLNTLRKAAPHMKIIAGEVDERLNDKKYILPGLGDFGDRYFGTT